MNVLSKVVFFIIGTLIGSFSTTLMFALASVGDTDTSQEEDDREQEAFLKELAETRKNKPFF